MIVYTCITGSKDSLRTQPEEEGVRYICFSDKPFKHPQWEYRPVEEEHTPRRTNRKYKVNSHLFFPGETTIYIDGNGRLEHKPSYYLKYLKKANIGVRAHLSRNCIYEEAEAVAHFGFEKISVIEEQMNKYIKDGYPKHNGLTENGLLVRDSSVFTEIFNRRWWDEIKTHSARDQLSFCYVLWKHPIKRSVIPRSEITFKAHNTRRTIEG